MLEQHVVHLPVLALLARTVRRRGRLAGVRVHLEREVAEHVTQLAGLDVVLLQGQERRREEPLTERTLVVGELDESHRRIGASQHRRIGHTRAHGPGRSDSALDRTLARQAQQLTELALDDVQIRCDAREVGLDRSEIARRVLWRLRPGGRSQGEDHQRRKEHPSHGSPRSHGWQMSLTQLFDAQSKLAQQCWPLWHLAAHEPPQSTSPSSPFHAPSPQCGTQQPVTPSQTNSWPQTSTIQSPYGQLELAQAGSAASMRPLQSSSRPLPHTSVGLVGTQVPAVALATVETSENPPSFFARTSDQYVPVLLTPPSW